MRHRHDFDALYREHFKAVLATAYLLTGNREQAMDLAQEAFARAYERWNAVSQHQQPAAWLQRVVTNLALSWHRRERVRRRPIPLESHVHAPDVPEPAVLVALSRLSPAQRAVIVLRYYADQSVHQVAEILGKRPGTIRALGSQALARLRSLLEAKGVRP